MSVKMNNHSVRFLQMETMLTTVHNKMSSETANCATATMFSRKTLLAYLMAKLKTMEMCKRMIKTMNQAMKTSTGKHAPHKAPKVSNAQVMIKSFAKLSEINHALNS
jgi:hypothetical protein